MDNRKKPFSDATAGSAKPRFPAEPPAPREPRAARGGPAPPPFTRPTPYHVREGSGRTSILRLSLETGTESFDTIQAFVSSYMIKRFRASSAQSLVIASYELLENALKYGSVASPVIFEVFDLDGVPEIEATNVAVAARLNQLVARVDALNQNAGAVYQEEFRKTLLPNGPRAMLGLARVAHEASMTLAYEVADQRVIVRARCRP